MSNLRWVLDKVAVESEPGLTNAQMMLTNSDLRPGETIPTNFILSINYSIAIVGSNSSRLTFPQSTLNDVNGGGPTMLHFGLRIL
jgi:hypothetical protein